jgi:FkbM family methyltransferase
MVMPRLSAIKSVIRRSPGDRPPSTPADEARARRKAERQSRKAEKKGRADFLVQAAPMTPYVAAEVGDELIFTSTRDTGVGTQVFVGRWRKDLTVLARAVEWLGGNGISLPAEPMFVDVGANIGTTTVMALRRHGFASAVAIEPSPANGRVLRLNVVANELEERVRILPVAVSDQEGEIRFDASDANWGAHRVSGDGRTATVGVEAVTLDELVDKEVVQPERVGLVWVDAQGHEAAVLAGASRVIEQATPIVVAIRPEAGDPETARPWVAHPATRAIVLDLLRANYTEIVELRKHSKRGRAIHPIDELDTLVDSFRHCQDLLLVRR